MHSNKSRRGKRFSISQKLDGLMHSLLDDQSIRNKKNSDVWVQVVPQ